MVLTMGGLLRRGALQLDYNENPMSGCKPLIKFVKINKDNALVEM